MADDNKVLFELGLDRAAWNQDAAAILSSAGGIDAALKGIIDQAGNVGRALGSIGDVAVNIDVNLEDLAAAETLIQGLGDGAVKINLDTSDIGPVQQSLADLAAADANVKIVADDGELVKAQGLVADIDGAAPSVAISADDAELDTAKGKVEDIDGAAPSVTVTASSSDIDALASAINRLSDTINVKTNTDSAKTDLDRIRGQLDDIKKIAKIDLLLNLPGNINELSQKLLDLPIISTLNDIDMATQRIIGRTGKDIPQAAGIIENIYNNAWGGTREEIADLLIETSRLGVANEELEATMLAVYQTTDVTGGDAVETLHAMEQLVANGIAPTFGNAGDVIAYSFQNGLDQGGDFLDTLIEYAPQFKEAGLSMEAMFNILNQGAEGGAFNLDKLADGFKELSNLTREEVGAFTTFGEETDRTTALEQLGYMDEAQAFAAGKITGDEYAAGLLDALRAVEDPAEQGLLTKRIFGATQAEEITVSTLLGIDLNEELPAEMQGAAEAGSNAFNNTIGTGVTELTRTVESELTAAINKAFNIDAIIDDWKLKIAAFSDEIQAGNGLLSAIEIGFNIPGFKIAVERFEAGIGEFAIGVLELIAGVQDFMGKDSSYARAQIALTAETQLAFNLKVANADEIEGEINRAVERGVSSEDINAAIGTAATELLDDGQIERAQQLLASLGEQRFMVGENLNDMGKMLADRVLESIENSSISPEEIQAAVDAGFIVPLEVGIGTDWADEVAVATKAAEAQFNEAIAGGDWDLAAQIAERMGDDPLEAFNTAFRDAMAGGDLNLAEMIVNEGGVLDPTLLIDVEEARNAASEARQAMFEELGGTEGLDEAILEPFKKAFITPPDMTPLNEALVQEQKIGLTLGDVFGEALTAVQTSTDGIAVATEDADQRVATALTGNTMTASFEAVGRSADAVFPRSAGVIVGSVAQMVAAEKQLTVQTNILTGALVGLIGQAGPGILALAQNLQNVANGASVAAQTFSAATAAGAAAAGGGSIEEFASGGQASGLFSAGEEGQEFIFADEQVAVLNNQSTEALVNAVRSVAGYAGIPMGGGGGQVFNQVNNWYVPSVAVGASVSQQLGASIRGQGK